MRPRAIAVMSLLAASACTDAATAPSAGVREEPPVAAFDSLWARYDATYPYFDYKKVDWAIRWAAAVRR